MAAAESEAPQTSTSRPAWPAISAQTRLSTCIHPRFRTVFQSHSASFRYSNAQCSGSGARVPPLRNCNILSRQCFAASMAESHRGLCFLPVCIAAGSRILRHGLQLQRHVSTGILFPSPHFLISHTSRAAATSSFLYTMMRIAL